MAREYAPVRVAIWADDDFRDLSMAAQHLYFLLLTSPTLNHAGVADWRPNRIASLARGWTEAEVVAAGEELESRLYLVIDWDSEEVLIRSFIRNDGLMKQPKMAVAMANSHAGIFSAGIRGVIVFELLRLRAEFPNLSGWAPEAAAELLSKRALDPASYPCHRGPKDPDPTSPASTPIKGSVNPKPTPNPEGSGNRSTFPAPVTSSYNYNLQPGAISAARDAPLRDAAPDATTLAAWSLEIFEVWVSIRRSMHNNPSTRQRNTASSSILESLRGHPYDLVLIAARAAAKAGFPNVDVEIAKITSAQVDLPAQPSTTDRKVNAGMELARQMREREEATQAQLTMGEAS